MGRSLTTTKRETFVDELRTSRSDFRRALLQTHLLAQLADRTLQEFPHRLPSPMREEITQVFAAAEQMMRLIHEALKVSQEHGREVLGQIEAAVRQSIAQSTSDDETPERERDDIAALCLRIFKDGIENSQADRLNNLYDFSLANRYQAVAMTFSYLDGFLGDVVRSLLRAEPRMLRRKKTLTWQDALNFESIDSLKENLIEQVVYEFGWGSVGQKFESLGKDYNVGLRSLPNNLEYLRLWEQRRHLIVHNGGRVNDRYLAESRDSALASGRKLPVETQDLDDLLEASLALSEDVYEAARARLLDEARSNQGPSGQP